MSLLYCLVGADNENSCFRGMSKYIKHLKCDINVISTTYMLILGTYYEKENVKYPINNFILVMC